MRRALTATVLITVAILATGCTDRSDPTASPTSSDVATAAQPSLDPLIEQACAAALKVNDQSTTTMTEQINKVIDAGNSDDTAAQTRGISQIQATFKTWSTTLRGQADKATDPELRSVLTQYAGAVEATIANVKGPDDLDKLYTFDDTELDQAANNLAKICN